MSATWRSLLRDERGFVITAELVLISTVLVLGLVAALSAVQTSLAGELSDVANSIGSLNQSYYTHGFHGCGSCVPGSSFLDQADSSDEEKADFAVGVEPCARVVGAVKTGCATPPCAPPCNPPCAPPCNPPCATPCAPPCAGCEPTLPAPPVMPMEAPVGTPCGSPCGTPCGTPCETPCSSPSGTPCGSPCGSPCGTPCGSAPCGTPVAAPCGSAPYGGGCSSSYGGYGSSYQVIDNWARFGSSVPPIVCPPGPRPFTGTDPYAPGAVSLQNMLEQGISYGGVCAPPAAALPAPALNSGAAEQPIVGSSAGPQSATAPQYDPALWRRGPVY